MLVSARHTPSKGASAMAKKVAATRTSPRTATKRPARKRSGPRTSSEPAASAARATSMPGPGNLSKMPKLMTPEQAIELDKTNAALALEVINTAIESAARLRKKQFEGEEEARAFQRKHAQSAAEARDAKGLLSAGQGAAQEAVEKSMQYWGEMFDLIVEIQKRLFTLIETQMDGGPGVRETRAAMAMLPDLSQMKK